MNTKVSRFIIVGGLIWITFLLFYIPQNRNLFQTNGEWVCGTLYSGIFDDAVKLQPYEAIAPEVCREFNEEFTRGFKKHFRNSSKVSLVMTYKGKGSYEAGFRCPGEGTLSLMEYLVSTTFASTYSRIAAQHGLPVLVANDFSGGGGETGDYFAGQWRWILVGTVFLSLFITIQVNKILKQQEKP